MSERPIPSSSTDNSPFDPFQLALKKVYSLHKEKVRELTEEKDDFKDGCDVLLQHKARLLEKVRSFQTHNEVLCKENTRLRSLLDTVRSKDQRGGACETCDHLQRSLSAIQEAYKHSIDEKDKMIHYLEERVAELSRQSSPYSKHPDLNLSNILTPDKSINDGEARMHGKSPFHSKRGDNTDFQVNASKKILEVVTNRLGRDSQNSELLEDDVHINRIRKNYEIQKQSPMFNKLVNVGENVKEDQSRVKRTQFTSRIDSESMYNAQSKHREDVSNEKETGAGNKEGGKESDRESPETARLRRLGLGRNKSKRNRYTEDSPPNKKRPKADQHGISVEFDETASKQPSNQKISSRSNILVQETCDPESDRTLSMSDRTASTSSDATPEKIRRRRKCSADTQGHDFAVPETLGMGLSSESDSESDDCDTQNTVKAWSARDRTTDLLHSPSSEIDSDVKLDKVLTKMNKEKDSAKALTSKINQNSKELNTEKTSKIDKLSTPSTFDESMKFHALRKGKEVTERDQVAGENSGSPTSPVFSGARNSRRSLASPFLFDDDDDPGSSKSIRKRSVNSSVLLSDTESPLLLQTASSVYQNPDYGQSPALKDSKKCSEKSNKKLTEYVSKSDTEQVTAGRLSQEISLSKRSVRNSERLKQSTLTQSFTSSPSSLPSLDMSPTKPEERAAIEKAIRLSLQEIDNNTVDAKGRKPLFGKSRVKSAGTDLVENIPPVFKRPPSPSTLKSPSKNSSNRKKSPGKKNSTDKQNSPDKHSPPKKKPHKTTLTMLTRNKPKKMASVDLDETVAPDASSMEFLSNPKTDNSLSSVTGLNESLDPDVSLTQYCSDTELISHRPGTRGRPRKLHSQLSESFNDSRKKQSLKNSDQLSSQRSQSLTTKGQSGGHESDNDEFDPDESTLRPRASKSKKKTITKHSSIESIDNEPRKTTPESLPSVEITGEEHMQSTMAGDEDEDDNEADVTLDPRFMRAHQFEGQVDESQGIPLSSCSFKFGGSRASKSSSSAENNNPTLNNDDDEEEENTLREEGRGIEGDLLMDDSFDRVPRGRQEDQYAHVDVVRKRAERRQLKATTCQECYDYYKSKGCSEEEIAKQIHDCSRHRARYLPPSTPEHFWSIGFPDTQECRERGYIAEESPSKKKPGYRRRRKLTMRFKSRQDEDDSQTDN